MDLLKIGMLNTPENRWQDALSVFDNITILRVFEEKEVPGINSINIKFNHIQWLLKVVLNRTKKVRLFNPLSRLLLIFLRLLCRKKLSVIKGIKYDEVHVSYNDFDESALLFMLVKPFLNKQVRVTRAYKEMRSNYDYLEKCSFVYSDRIVFNTEHSKRFIEEKYGSIFKEKQLVFNIDEDYRLSSIINEVTYDGKLSAQDGKIHAVILAGRVMSNPNDKRSGSRLYYIDLIKKLLNCGIVVHLQAKKIEEYKGYNPYFELAEKNEIFKIEHTIDFSQDVLSSYRLLSQYDIGILHAHYNNKSSYEFDYINIPNRYYEYEIAHVVPVEIINQNVIIDDKAKTNHAICVKDFADLSLEKIKNIVWDTPTFKNYIEYLYGDRHYE